MSSIVWIILAVVVIALLAAAFVALRGQLEHRRGQRRVEARARVSEAGRLGEVSDSEQDLARRAEQLAAGEHEQAEEHLQRARRAEKEAEVHRDAAEDAARQATTHQARAERVDPDR
jgi:phage protein D